MPYPMIPLDIRRSVMHYQALVPSQKRLRGSVAAADCLMNFTFKVGQLVLSYWKEGVEVSDWHASVTVCVFLGMLAPEDSPVIRGEPVKRAIVFDNIRGVKMVNPASITHIPDMQTIRNKWFTNEVEVRYYLDQARSLQYIWAYMYFSGIYKRFPDMTGLWDRFVDKDIVKRVADYFSVPTAVVGEALDDFCPDERPCISIRLSKQDIVPGPVGAFKMPKVEAQYGYYKWIHPFSIPADVLPESDDEEENVEHVPGEGEYHTEPNELGEVVVFIDPPEQVVTADEDGAGAPEQTVVTGAVETTLASGLSNVTVTPTEATPTEATPTEATPTEGIPTAVKTTAVKTTTVKTTAVKTTAAKAVAAKAVAPTTATAKAVVARAVAPQNVHGNKRSKVPKSKKFTHRKRS